MKVLKSFIKITIYILISIFSFIIIYLSSEYFLSRWSVAEVSSLDKKYQIFIKSNGVHTDIVLPIKSDIINWSELFPFENTLSKSTDFSYVGIGWGDKGFYLDTPTWAELKFSTAFKAAFWLGESAVHATFYREMKEGEDCKKINLTTEQYQELIKYVDNTFDKDAFGNYIFVKTNAVYGKNDAFYEAKGSYNFLFTCNTWTNDGLKVAGQKAAFWTATEKGIFQHYKD